MAEQFISAQGTLLGECGGGVAAAGKWHLWVGLLGAVMTCWSGAALGESSGEPVYGSGRVGGDRKGSLLVLSAVELRWQQTATGGWQLSQDTFVALTNDASEEIWVQAYLVNGDPPTAATDTERVHPGWNTTGTQFALSANRPVYWSTATGEPIGFTPFAEALDPGSPPGRPDPNPDDVGTRVLRGYLVAWAVNLEGREIRWNHLTGSAVVVDYVEGSAWEHTAWAFQAQGAAHGEEPLSCSAYSLDTGQCVDARVVPGQMDLDGYEYDACASALMFNFDAVVTAPCPAGAVGVPVETDLILLPCEIDLRQDGSAPITTKAKFDAWNENEVYFSGTERCITGWDMAPLRYYTGLGVPNHFLCEMLQTNRGKARVLGVASTLCNAGGTVSQNAALLGVARKMLRFADQRVGKSCLPLTIQGRQIGHVRADIVAPSPEKVGKQGAGN